MKDCSEHGDNERLYHIPKIKSNFDCPQQGFFMLNEKELKTNNKKFFFLHNPFCVGLSPIKKRITREKSRADLLYSVSV